MFRRPPFIKTSERNGLGAALSEFVNDADKLGTALVGYAKNVLDDYGQRMTYPTPRTLWISF